jgi:hypothetical protein
MKLIEKLAITLLILLFLYLIYDNLSRINMNNRIECTEVEDIIEQESSDLGRVKLDMNSILNYKGSSDEIILIQRLLSCILKKPLKQTGKFDKETKRSLIIFQKILRLTPTGKMDRETKLELCKRIHLLYEE